MNLNTRSLILLVAVTLLCLGVAADTGDDVLLQRRDHRALMLERRQEDNSSMPVPPSTTIVPPADPPTTTIPTTTTTDTPSETPTDPPSSSPTTSTDSSVSSTPTDSSPSSTPTTRSSVRSTGTPTTKVQTTLITSKVGDADVIVTATSFTIETPVIDVPAPTDESAAGQAEDGETNSSGLSPSNRNTVIGVVVGVGGAVILGALAIVAWRRSRKRNNPVDDDDLMRRDGSPLASSGKGTSPDASPFQATLDQYHQPKSVNPASNF